MNAIRLARLVQIREMKASEFNTTEIKPNVFPSLYGLNYNDTIQVNLWRGHADVPLRVEPIEGKQWMFRVAPTEALATGRYGFYFEGTLLKSDMILSVRRSGQDRGKAVYFAVAPRTSATAGPPTELSQSCGAVADCNRSSGLAFNQNRFAESLAYAESGARLNPDNPESLGSWFFAARAAQALGDYERMERGYDKYFAIAGDKYGLGFDVCRKAVPGRCEPARLTMRKKTLGFLEGATKLEKIFETSPEEVSASIAQGDNPAPHVWIEINYGGTKYKLVPKIYNARNCTGLIYFFCAEPGPTQQRRVAEYIVRKINEFKHQ